MTEVRAKTVLIIEDEPLVAMLLEQMVREAGFETLPVPNNPAEAQESSSNGMADVAILDANLWGQSCRPYVDSLNSRGIPFILASGYSPGDLREQYGNIKLLSKPFEFEELREALESST